MMLDEKPELVYLDLERPDDARALTDPQAFFRLHRGKLLCLDEIQRIPEIFPAIRTEVDEVDKAGRFLVLGSASPDLLRQTSESLAGRIRYFELTPFLLEEIDGSEARMRSLWLRGGFPRSFLASTDDASFEWRQDFIRTFLERDIPSLGFRVPGTNMRRLWTMLSHLNAQVLNRSKLGEAIGVSHHTVQHHLNILIDSFMIRALEPLEVNVRKRLVKSPKIYFRDTGILHGLSGIRTQQQLLSHPDYGSSWEAFALETICSSPRIGNRWQCFFYGAHTGGEIDLVLDNGKERIAIESKASSAPDLPANFLAALKDTGIRKAWIVAPLKRVIPLGHDVLAGSPTDFLNSIT